MATLKCVDGSALEVVPVPVIDRDRRTYEVTLGLRVDGQPFGEVGERCGYFLAATARRLDDARADGSPESARWPDRDDRFPVSALDGGLRAWAADTGLDGSEAVGTLQRYLPRDRDLFCFRHRDPDDLSSEGSLRCGLETEKRWVGGSRAVGAGGRWVLAQRAVVEAWGDRGTGLRAVLTSGELAEWLAALLSEAAEVGATYDVGSDVSALRRPAG